MSLNKKSNFSTYHNFEKEKIRPNSMLTNFWEDIIKTYEKQYDVTVHGYIKCTSYALHPNIKDTNYSYQVVSDNPFHHFLENNNPGKLHIFQENETRVLYIQYKVYDRELKSLSTYLTPIYLVTDKKFEKHEKHIHMQNLSSLLKNTTPYKLSKKIALNYHFKF